MLSGLSSIHFQALNIIVHCFLTWNIQHINLCSNCFLVVIYQPTCLVCCIEMREKHRFIRYEHLWQWFWQPYVKLEGRTLNLFMHQTKQLVCLYTHTGSLTLTYLKRLERRSTLQIKKGEPAVNLCHVMHR